MGRFPFIQTSKTRREGYDSNGNLRKPHGETVFIQRKDDPNGFHITDERGAEKKHARARTQYTEPKPIPRSVDSILKEKN